MPDDIDEWPLIEVECSTCGAINQLHEQRPEWLEVRHPVGGHLLGVDWECTACGARNNIGGETPAAADVGLLECESCHSTFAPSQAGIADGQWACPVCATDQAAVVIVGAHEAAASGDTAGATA